MTWWAAGLWGLGGGAAIELVDLYKFLRTQDGSYRMPNVEEGFWVAYLISVLINLALGFFAAWALYASEQLDSPLTAVGVGTGATGFLEHVSRTARSETQEVTTE